MGKAVLVPPKEMGLLKADDFRVQVVEGSPDCLTFVGAIKAINVQRRECNYGGITGHGRAVKRSGE